MFSGAEPLVQFIKMALWGTVVCEIILNLVLEMLMFKGLIFFKHWWQCSRTSCISFKEGIL